MPPTTCPVCGAERDPVSTPGPCPACLLRLGLKAGRTAGDAGAEDDRAADVPSSYRVLALLGGTARSTVYLADLPPTGALAVVKVITDVAIGGEREAAFRADIAVLRDLRHPNIARVFDAGLTRCGRPYVVSEFVAGQPIDRHSAGLDWVSVLALVAGTCRALAHAHARGIVHGHLVPSNILVLPGNGTPRPALTDLAHAGWRGEVRTAASDLADLIALVRAILLAGAGVPEEALGLLVAERVDAPGGAARLADAIEACVARRTNASR